MTLTAKTFEQELPNKGQLILVTGVKALAHTCKFKRVHKLRGEPILEDLWTGEEFTISSRCRWLPAGPILSVLEA